MRQVFCPRSVMRQVCSLTLSSQLPHHYMTSQLTRWQLYPKSLLSICPSSWHQKTRTQIYLFTYSTLALLYQACIQYPSSQRWQRPNKNSFFYVETFYRSTNKCISHVPRALLIADSAEPYRRNAHLMSRSSIYIYILYVVIFQQSIKQTEITIYCNINLKHIIKWKFLTVLKDGTTGNSMGLRPPPPHIHFFKPCT